MDKLLDAVAAVVFLVSPEKVKAIAARIRRTDSSKAVTVLAGVVGTPVASGVVDLGCCRYRRHQPKRITLPRILQD